MVECTPVISRSYNYYYFCWPMTPFIIGLPYNHPQPPGSWQFANKNFSCCQHNIYIQIQLSSQFEHCKISLHLTPSLKGIVRAKVDIAFWRLNNHPTIMGQSLLVVCTNWEGIHGYTKYARDKVKCPLSYLKTILGVF